MEVIACRYRTDEGECILENKPCDGCKDAPHFIDWEGDQDENDLHAVHRIVISGEYTYTIE